jgi:hypothetical protein
VLGVMTMRHALLMFWGTAEKTSCDKYKKIVNLELSLVYKQNLASNIQLTISNMNIYLSIYKRSHMKHNKNSQFQ